MNSQRSKFSGLAICCLVLAVVMSASGCKVANRRPVKIASLKTALVPGQQRLAVRIEETLPGKDLNVTVWDNVAGPFADAKEAKQIGYTQNYNQVVLASLAGDPALAMAAAPALIESRIVIPYGPIFEQTFQSGLQQAFPNAVMLTNSQADAVASASSPAKYLVQVRIAEFRVWEGPLNHINLTSQVVCHVQLTSDTSGAGSTFEVDRRITAQKIGSTLSTSGGFIRKMNDIANTFAGDVTTEILATLQKTTEP